MATARWQDFFLFGDPVERRALRIASINLDREESLAIGRGDEPPRRVQTRPTQGRELRDFLWPSSMVPVVARSRVIDLLVSEGLTGWSTYEVDVFDRDGAVISDYVGFTVTGRVGPLAEPEGDPARFVFDPATWDGSDFFRPSNSGNEFITARARSALRAANVRNVRIEPVTEAERPYVLRT